MASSKSDLKTYSQGTFSLSSVLSDRTYTFNSADPSNHICFVYIFLFATSGKTNKLPSKSIILAFASS